MTITIDQTTLLLLAGAVILLYIGGYTLATSVMWLRTGAATFTLRVGGPYSLLVVALCAAGLAGIWRVLA